MSESHFEQVVALLRMEAEAVARTAARLAPAEVERAVRLLAECRGKVVTIGVGKSGHIAQKAAATLTSTGTPSVFLHPSDALHGGMGLVSEEDVCLFISNSGETAELLELLPYLQHRSAHVVAVVGNTASSLARRADVVLDASVEQEACPLNLAPTTSTTVALAICDALAMTLMSVKRLTPEDFALNHPGGRLGKRLTLKVSDLMHGGEENPSVSESAPLLEVVQAISRGGLGAVCIAGEGGRLVGIVTDGDLRRALERVRLEDLAGLTAAGLMTRGPVVVKPDMLAHAALQLMENRPSQIAVLPVVDAEGRAVGLLRLHDIVRSGL
ncbi:MAG: arabinose-5-phosphate isomerase [Acidobacteriota bacterium]|jgi:arabinose-5-phosphate isomerase|nr:arabinose-5-phosphate isomerase [Acidobacteriota bacterium]MDT7809772.1 arabinose-5-phosphate isomerase [Acidobacteriota bacterium]